MKQIVEVLCKDDMIPKYYYEVSDILFNDGRVYLYDEYFKDTPFLILNIEEVTYIRVF